jgi:glycosyltransferase involved in cell wall biosynthesis
MLITVAIATYNRPDLLQEALSSVAAQTYRDWEVIVVDDASEPPVDASAVRAVVGDRFKLVRHGSQQGVVASKNAGVDHASGEIILHLDDDDLLKENALRVIAETFSAHKHLDCIFLNVEPFGKFASGSAEMQDAALSRLLERVKTEEKDGIVFLGDGLFDALMKSVPLSMQRPAARRGAWNIVGTFTPGLIFSEPEWTIRAAIHCRTALIRTPLSMWRVNGQNFASSPSMKQLHGERGRAAKRILLEQLREDARMNRARVKAVRSALAEGYFNEAYHHAEQGNRRAVWHALFRSFIMAPGWRHLRLGLKSLLPVGSPRG